MRQKIAAVGCLAAAILLAAPVGADDRTITCESRHYRYQDRRADTDNRVRLERQQSGTRCRLWDNWGYDNRGVWVDRGCAADFRVGKDDGVNKGVAIGVAAAAGIAIAAAVAASRDHHDDKVPSWAVGTFRGYDESEGTDVEMTIYPGGSLSGSAGGTTFSGRWEDGRLQAGRRRFRIERFGNGFAATDDTGRGDRISFRRVGHGY